MSKRAERAQRAAAPQRGARPVQRTARFVVSRLANLVLDVHHRGLENIPPTGPLLLVGNHSSLVDGPIIDILGPRPVAFLVKSEAFVGPLRPFLNWAGQIEIHRESADRTALTNALDILGAGGAVGVFPAGTRGTDLAEVQHGVAWLALRSGAPVAPVACLGTENFLAKGRKIPHLRSHVDVVYGRPEPVVVPGNPRSRTAVNAAAEQIRLRLVEHVAAATAARDYVAARIGGSGE